MNKVELFNKIINEFNDKKILNDLILLGSWCLLIYKEHYKSEEIPLFKTTDIDLMIPFPKQIKNKVDIPKLLEKYGFDPIYSIRKNYVKFDNPDLRIEFLTPEYGKGTDKPHDIPNYKINAQGLRFISLAIDYKIQIKYKDIPINIPEPSCFLLIKLLTIPKRQNVEKAKKDIYTAKRLGDFIVNDPGQKKRLIEIFSNLNEGWKKTILRTVRKYTDNLYEILNNRNIENNKMLDKKDKYKGMER